MKEVLRIIRKWIVPSFALLALCGAFAGGALWHEYAYIAPYQKDLREIAGGGDEDVEGRFYTFRPPNTGAGAANGDNDELNALGYLSGYVEAPEMQGVTVFEPEKAYSGLNLYTSGHAPEAYLMDMEGRVVHRWRYAFEKLWPDVEQTANYTQYFRRTHLFDNGDLLAIFEPHGIFKLDKDSELLWSNQNAAHHDLYVHDDGTISLLTRRAHPVLWFSTYGTVIEDFISQLRPDGKVIREVSLMECFRDSRYSSYLKRAERGGDVLHANALKFLDGKHEHLSPAFRRGNFLVSIRELDALVVVDIDAGEVVWALSGMWSRQHEPTLLENGHLLLFDNLGNAGRSKVVEVEPLRQSVVWTYGVERHEPLFSGTCGAVARLPNGNTLITESNNGRVIEVTPDKQIVWEFVSPHRAGEHDELIATVLHMERLSLTFSPDWLKAGAEGSEDGAVRSGLRTGAP